MGHAAVFGQLDLAQGTVEVHLTSPRTDTLHDRLTEIHCDRRNSTGGIPADAGQHAKPHCCPRKVAAMLRSPAEMARLAEFQLANHGIAVATMGMGILAPVSRPTLYHARVVSTLLFVLAIAAPAFGLFLLFFIISK